jgi:hypothetical protein
VVKLLVGSTGWGVDLGGVVYILVPVEVTLPGVLDV